MRPYRVVSTNLILGNYFLSELNGSLLRGPITRNRLKRYYPREAEYLTTLPSKVESDRLSKGESGEEADPAENGERVKRRMREAKVDT